ncbi:phenylacetate--CoA ligase family protein [Desulfocastanea catecholica]
MIVRLKKVIEKIPEPIGKYFAYVPYAMRLGSDYNASIKNISFFDSATTDEKKDFIFKQTRKIITHAIGHNSFYQKIYADAGFYLDDLRSFDDIQKIPLITKADLKNVSLAERTTPESKGFLVNTGGTSGDPLEFYLDRQAFAREWAHMHTIWSQVDYQPTDLKLTFRGKNLGSSPLRYNPVHNEYVVNTYLPLKIVIDAIEKVVKKKSIKYLHGYPSTIYNFALEVARCDKQLVTELNRTLKGILLGSEYPAPIYRDAIKKVFKAPTISWYGHSEMAVLAYEQSEDGKYHPFHSYGYCEAVLDGSGNYRLVGTSYFNEGSPFIRYDTGDLIFPLFADGILDSFRIAEGRVGEFIVDRIGQRVSLTALIFGRHHKIFGSARYLQIRQDRAGEATLMITLPVGESLSDAEITAGFDTSHVEVAFNYLCISEPIKTPAGKIPLLIKG